MDYTKPYKYISIISEKQSISLAAEELNIQQPALSKYLKNIENELGAELFDRSTTPLTLTLAGKYYLQTAQEIIEANKQLHKKINDIKQNDLTFNVGISHSRAPYLVPLILKNYINKFPTAKVIFREGTTKELNQDLLQGKNDLIISILDNDTKKFEYIELFDEKVLLAVPASYEYTNFEKAFEDLNIISSGKGQFLTGVLEKMPKYNSSVECQNISTTISLVSSGIGATLIPSYMAQNNTLKNIKTHIVPNKYTPHTKRKVCIFFRKTQFLSSYEKEFIKSAQSISYNN